MIASVPKTLSAPHALSIGTEHSCRTLIHVAGDSRDNVYLKKMIIDRPRLSAIFVLVESGFAVGEV